MEFNRKITFYLFIYLYVSFGLKEKILISLDDVYSKISFLLKFCII